MLQRGQIFLTPIGTILRIATQALPSETSLFHQTLSARAFWDGEEVIRPIVRRLARGNYEVGATHTAFHVFVSVSRRV